MEDHTGARIAGGTKSKWWLFYIILLLAVEVKGYSILIAHPEAGFLEFVCLLLSIGLYVGLFGFFLNKGLIRPVFWHGFLIVLIVFGHAYAFLSQIQLYEDIPESQMVVGYVVGVLMYIPAAAALFLYGRKTDRAWAGAS